MHVLAIQVEDKKTKRRLRLSRDVVMFGLGVGAFTYEVASGGDRPNILYASLALMGVAAYLRGAALKNGGGG